MGPCKSSQGSIRLECFLSVKAKKVLGSYKALTCLMRALKGLIQPCRALKSLDGPYKAPKGLMKP